MSRSVSECTACRAAYFTNQSHNFSLESQEAAAKDHEKNIKETHVKLTMFALYRTPSAENLAIHCRGVKSWSTVTNPSDSSDRAYVASAF